VRHRPGGRRARCGKGTRQAQGWASPRSTVPAAQDDLELTYRLCFFLWSSIPDDVIPMFTGLRSNELLSISIASRVTGRTGNRVPSLILWSSIPDDATCGFDNNIGRLL
jgi:hypothetical protein